MPISVPGFIDCSCASQVLVRQSLCAARVNIEIMSKWNLKCDWKGRLQMQPDHLAKHWDWIRKNLYAPKYRTVWIILLVTSSTVSTINVISWRLAFVYSYPRLVWKGLHWYSIIRYIQILSKQVCELHFRSQMTQHKYFMSRMCKAKECSPSGCRTLQSI